MNGDIMLIEKIKKDLTEAMKDGNYAKRDALRMVMGEIPRLNMKAGTVPTDEQLYKIIRSLIKSETLVCEYSGQDPKCNLYINILDYYLPIDIKMMDEDKIRQWIIDNIDIGAFNPKLVAMGAIMKQLKGKADGALVKKVLISIDKGE